MPDRIRAYTLVDRNDDGPLVQSDNRDRHSRGRMSGEGWPERSRLLCPTARKVLWQPFRAGKAGGLSAAETTQRDRLTCRINRHPGFLRFPGAGLENDGSAAAVLLRFGPDL